MSYAKTTYSGPVKNRGVDAQGRAKVSREELADFRRKYGADKTLRDLLNADRTGKTPASENAPLARGLQGANVAPQTRSNASRTMANRAASDAAQRRADYDARAKAARESASEMARESRRSSGPERAGAEAPDNTQYLKNGGLVRRGALKSHGKAC